MISTPLPDHPPGAAASNLRPVDLAKQAPFKIGRAEVRPGLREIEDEGEIVRVEPRVMEVLVVLAQAQDGLASRSELIDRCWGGRVVGDDAINRTLMKLRRLRWKGPAPFQVITVPKIGYRLSVGPTAKRPRAGRHWRGWAMVGVVVVLAAVALGWGVRRLPTSPEPLVRVAALRAVGQDAAAAAIATSLSAEILAVLNQSGVQTTSAAAETPAGKTLTSDLVLEGSVTRGDASVRVQLVLKDAHAGLTLWTAQLDRPPDRADGLSAEAAAAATEAIYTALEPRLQKGLRLDPETLALSIRGSQRLTVPDALRGGVARRSLEQVVQRAPSYANGHGALAVALANEARTGPLGEREALLTRARREANAAIRIDPYAAGAAYDALFMSRRTERPADIVAAEDGLLEGLRRAPEFAFLTMRECRLLTEVGLLTKALSYCRRAIALRPLSPPIGFTYSQALQRAGEGGLAARAVATAAARNPGHAMTRLTAFEFAAFGQAPQDGRALLLNPPTAPDLSPAGIAAFEAYFAARASHRPADVEAAVMALRDAVAAEQLSLRLGVTATAQLGRADDAFALLEAAPLDTATDWYRAGFLLAPALASLRNDPRFWRAAARLGLVRYWMTRNALPDFCGRETPVTTCRAGVAQALAHGVKPPAG